MQFASDAQAQHGAGAQVVTGSCPGCRSSVFEQRSVGEGRVSTAKPLTKAGRCDFRSCPIPALMITLRPCALSLLC
jgi:hypothetical protein